LLHLQNVRYFTQNYCRIQLQYMSLHVKTMSGGY
jgi:hypothetical protein